jgi:hypothetical protein
MHRNVFLAGALLVAIGLALFSVKTLQYGIPVAPTENRGPWQEELRAGARGDGARGSGRALLPSTEGGQVIFDERSSSDRLEFSAASAAATASGSGRLAPGRARVVYQFASKPPSHAAAFARPCGAAPPLGVWGQPSPGIPSDAPQVKELLDSLRLPTAADQPARIRTIYSFVSHEIATVRSASSDALLTLARREGNGEGKERLLVTLLRAAGIPARLAHGLGLREGRRPTSCLGRGVGGRGQCRCPPCDFFGPRRTTTSCSAQQRRWSMTDLAIGHLPVAARAPAAGRSRACSPTTASFVALALPAAGGWQSVLRCCRCAARCAGGAVQEPGRDRPTARSCRCCRAALRGPCTSVWPWSGVIVGYLARFTLSDCAC